MEHVLQQSHALAQINEQRRTDAVWSSLQQRHPLHPQLQQPQQAAAAYLSNHYGTAHAMQDAQDIYVDTSTAAVGVPGPSMFLQPRQALLPPRSSMAAAASHTDGASSDGTGTLSRQQQQFLMSMGAAAFAELMAQRRGGGF